MYTNLKGWVISKFFLKMKKTRWNIQKTTVDWSFCPGQSLLLHNSVALITEGVMHKRQLFIRRKNGVRFCSNVLMCFITPMFVICIISELFYRMHPHLPRIYRFFSQYISVNMLFLQYSLYYFRKLRTRLRY